MTPEDRRIAWAIVAYGWLCLAVIALIGCQTPRTQADCAAECQKHVGCRLDFEQCVFQCVRYSR